MSKSRGADFAAQVEAFGAAAKRNAEVIFLASVQDVIEEAQKTVAEGGNMPVDTGFLRASLVVTLDGTVPSARTRPGSGTPRGPDISAAIAGADIEMTITAAWTAVYAPYVEYGARGRPGRFFVWSAMERWPQIVEANAKKVTAQVGG